MGVSTSPFSSAPKSTARAGLREIIAMIGRDARSAHLASPYVRGVMNLRGKVIPASRASRAARRIPPLITPMHHRSM